MEKKEIQALFNEANADIVAEIANIKAQLKEDKGNEELKAELAEANKKSEEIKADFEAKFADVEKIMFEANDKTEDKMQKFADGFITEILKTKQSGISTFAPRVEKLRQKFALSDGQNITTDADGGYLVPDVLAADILKAVINEGSGILANVRRTPMGQNLSINTRTGIPAVVREGEGDTSEDGKSTYSQQTLTAQRASVRVPATWESLNFTQGDARARITSDVAEGYNAKYEWELLNGDSSSKQMEGILGNATVIAAATETSTASAIVYEDLIDLESSVKIGNWKNLRYVMDRTTWGAIRKLQDGAGAYILTPNDKENQKINGIPVIITGKVTVSNGTNVASRQVMPVIADGAYPVLLADFTGYLMGDAQGMTLIFDDKTGANTATFYWNFHAWNTGKVALPEKFKLLKIKAASAS